MALVRTLLGLARLPLTHLPPGGNRGSSRSGFTINTGENRNVGPMCKDTRMGDDYPGSL